MDESECPPHNHLTNQCTVAASVPVRRRPGTVAPAATPQAMALIPAVADPKGLIADEGVGAG